MQDKALLSVGMSLALALAACGGSEPTPNAGEAPSAAMPTSEPMPAETAMPSSAPSTSQVSPPPETPKPTITASAFKITPNKGSKAKAVEVKADGSIMSDGKPGGKFTTSELQDAEGKTVATVAADGTISSPSMTATAKFNDKNEIEVDGKPVITIGDDGAVKIADAKGKQQTAPVKVEGITADGRRAAALVVMEYWFKPVAPPAAKGGDAKGGEKTTPPAGGGKPPAGGKK